MKSSDTQRIKHTIQWKLISEIITHGNRQDTQKTEQLKDSMASIMSAFVPNILLCINYRNQRQTLEKEMAFVPFFMSCDQTLRCQIGLWFGITRKYKGSVT